MDIKLKPLYKLYAEISEVIEVREINQGNHETRITRNINSAVPSLKRDSYYETYKRRTKELETAMKHLNDVKEVLEKYNKL